MLWSWLHKCCSPGIQVLQWWMRHTACRQVLREIGSLCMEIFQQSLHRDTKHDSCWMLSSWDFSDEKLTQHPIVISEGSLCKDEGNSMENVSRLLFVHVIQNRPSILSRDSNERFQSKNAEWKIYYCGFTLSWKALFFLSRWCFSEYVKEIY